MTDSKPLGFNRKKRPSKEYTELPKPESSFNANNTSLLDSIQKEEDVLKTNNKSLGIPVSVWCKFMALLDVSENDYTYELMEELVEDSVKQLSKKDHQDYEDSLKRKEESERLKIKKKAKKL